MSSSPWQRRARIFDPRGRNCFPPMAGLIRSPRARSTFPLTGPWSCSWPRMPVRHRRPRLLHRQPPAPAPSNQEPPRPRAARPRTQLHRQQSPRRPRRRPLPRGWHPEQMYRMVCMACHDTDGKGKIVKLAMPSYSRSHRPQVSGVAHRRRTHALDPRRKAVNGERGADSLDALHEG